MATFKAIPNEVFYSNIMCCLDIIDNLNLVSVNKENYTSNNLNMFYKYFVKYIFGIKSIKEFKKIFHKNNEIIEKEDFENMYKIGMKAIKNNNCNFVIWYSFSPSILQLSMNVKVQLLVQYMDEIETLSRIPDPECLKFQYLIKMGEVVVECLSRFPGCCLDIPSFKRIFFNKCIDLMYQSINMKNVDYWVKYNFIRKCCSFVNFTKDRINK